MSNQDWYMYVYLIDGELCRVNISKLLHENIRPQFELVQKVKDVRGRGWISLPRIHLFKNSLTNTILQLQLPNSRRSRFSWDVVTPIDTKLYVLGKSLEFQAFQVFDPFHGSWKNLPLPPFSHPPADLIPYGHFEWGHILAVFNKQRQDQAYIFDTNEEKWMTAVGLPRLACAVEFSGFLIGMLEMSPQGLVAYKLDDENGLPDYKSQHTIHDLWEIFYPPLQRQGEYGQPTFLTRFGDDRVLFLSTTEMGKFVIVAVFRVSITTISGIPAVGAVFEHKQLYNLGKQRYTFIYSTFLMKNAPSYDHLDSLPPISLDSQPLDDDDDDGYGYGYDYDDNPDDHAVLLGPPPPAMLMADVEWDDGIKDKSLYLCFVEHRTDSSVSYIIKAMKFRDLISSSHYGLLRQVASTSGCHLAGLPSCGVLGSQILFASGRQDGLRKWLESELLNSMDIHVFDVKSDDPMNYDNIKPFTKFFKGMKPEPVLVELQGKLYALAGLPTPKYLNSGPFFEVFDPREKEWSPLPDPPPYTLYAPLPDTRLSYNNNNNNNYSYAIAGTNILVSGGNSPGVFRFDVAADPIDRDWRLIENWCVGFNGHTSTLVVDSVDGNGGSDFILFTHTNRGGFKESTSLGVYLMSREFDSIVCLPPLELPESVSSFLRAQDCYNDSSSSFVHLGGRRVCLVLSSPFEGPYSRTVDQLGEVDKMSVFVLVFEFQVTEKRESLAARILFHRLLEYDTNSCATRNTKTSDAHMDKPSGLLVQLCSSVRKGEEDVDRTRIGIYIYMDIDYHGVLCRLNLSKLCEETRPEFECLLKFGADQGRRSRSKIRLFKDSLTSLHFKLPRSDFFWNVVTTIDDKLYVLSSRYKVFQVFDALHGFWKIRSPTSTSF